ncbi:trichohyalin isoform X2 [Solenopsis invicta]|uniref:trichohyalin isoform X2 n=1 Tax=Solenopsis invicta TaxID=13686 RepID=UPI0001FEB855|nr:trichohyalin isoform X2 [Solenopsis invicta]
MNSKSKDEIRDIILKDLQNIYDRRKQISKRLSENIEESLSYLRDLFSQLSQPSSGPLVPKTPKILRKKAVQRIETIHEDKVFQQENISPASSLQSINEEVQKEDEAAGSRTSKRGASKRAADNIKKQSSILNDPAKKIKRESQNKRKKSPVSSSDEDNERVSKYSKVEENPMEAKEPVKKMTRKKSKQIAQSAVSTETAKQTEKIEEKDNFESPVLGQFSTANSKKSQSKDVNKVVDDAIVAPGTDDVEEPSMYEDAIGKPVPIMNSTLKNSLLMLPEKTLNATVILERIPQRSKLNETVVIQKTANAKNSTKLKEVENSKKTLQNDTQSHQAPAQYNDCNGLITDDESSPEVKKPKKQLGRKQLNKKQTKGALSMSSEDEIPNTPIKTRKIVQESKTTYKSNALFSPYAKESVKKRVEAFEQAVAHSPKSVDVDAPLRMTRTKTRAMVNAEVETEMKNGEKNVAQILARKSLAKAKKISLAKQQKDNDEFKENKDQLPERINKLLMTQTDKPNIKQLSQLKTTPLSKLKLMQPTLSVTRLQTPSNMQNLSNYSKTLTASRANIVTNVESFIYHQPPKSITKTNSVEKLEEKKRYEEDARKKREETLRLQTEEKRRKRQEKELKNKLAREAKVKQELEKRQKAEKEKEEKAKLALLMQEKQREELEKKRFALLQRAQEKEERRKLEEQQRMQRVQEQEEAERLLAEQRRREQEAERRKEAEARAQQAETLKQKNQLLAAAKYKQQANNKNHGATNYVLDSEPDDDESDDENRPKHEIPLWAQAHVRKPQLAMQQHIPQTIIYKFFNTRKCTVDLTELFHGIDRSRLKRTSSAIWKTPPRISMMETEFIQPKLL